MVTGRLMERRDLSSGREGMVEEGEGTAGGFRKRRVLFEFYLCSICVLLCSGAVSSCVEKTF